MNRRSMIGKMLGGVAAIVGGLALRGAERPLTTAKVYWHGAEWQGADLYTLSDDGKQWNRLTPPRPTITSVDRHPDGSLLVTFEVDARRAISSIEKVSESISRFSGALNR